MSEDFGIHIELGFQPMPLPASMIDHLMDQVAALDSLAEDLLDWTVGADLTTGIVEVELTIESANAEAALSRGQGLITTAVQMLDSSPRTRALSAVLV